MTASALPPSFGRPHVVLLGAGASRAACPDGDKHGRILPLMGDLIQALDLEPILRRHSIDLSGCDFEELYSDLASTGRHDELVAQVEASVFDYFSALELPDAPTIYDRLILSLRSKDMIATFNWDPLLSQAHSRAQRCFGIGALPRLVFLHGSVAIGYCNKHTPANFGIMHDLCQRCRRPLRSTRLMFPCPDKDYTEHPSIEVAWKDCRSWLGVAYLFTVFGYSAPKTDRTAGELLKTAWGDPVRQRSIEEIEIIDDPGVVAKTGPELRSKWDPFICREHYRLRGAFEGSLAASYPRRSCEAFFKTTMQGDPPKRESIPARASWSQIEDILHPIIKQEQIATNACSALGGATPIRT